MLPVTRKCTHNTKICTQSFDFCNGIKILDYSQKAGRQSPTCFFALGTGTVKTRIRFSGTGAFAKQRHYRVKRDLFNCPVSFPLTINGCYDIMVYNIPNTYRSIYERRKKTVNKRYNSAKADI